MCSNGIELRYSYFEILLLSKYLSLKFPFFQKMFLLPIGFHSLQLNYLIVNGVADLMMQIKVLHLFILLIHS